MTAKRINIADIVRDINFGLGDVPIMEKYNISPGEYMGILERIKEMGQFHKSDFEARLITLKTGTIKEDARETPRCYLIVGVLISDAKNPTLSGRVLDLTEKGCQVIGIECRVGETRRFRIQIEGFEAEVFQAEFVAECRWKTERPDDGVPLAGFEIRKIAQKDRERLREMIELITLCDA